MSDSECLVRAYYAAFNAGDVEAFLALLTEDVVHDINQGGREIGRDAFRRFLGAMNRCYRERIGDLVVLSEASGRHAAATFTVHGTYLATDPGLPHGTPPARGQRYTLAAGAFFTLRDGRVSFIANHYNLSEWLMQISG